MNITAKQDGVSTAESVEVEARLTALIRREKPGIYGVYCPALDLWSQGDTVAEAKKNIAEAVELFIESCYERGMLNQVLLDCGFKFAGQRQARIKRVKNLRKRSRLPITAPKKKA